MVVFASLKCQACSSPPSDFVVLCCGHVLCGTCLGNLQTKTEMCVSVACPCGITTNMPIYNNKKKESGRSSLTKVKSQTDLRNKSQHILDFTNYTVEDQISKTEKQRLYPFLNSNNFRGCSSSKNNQHYFKEELNNQVKLIQLRFKRYINQINRHYSRVISKMNEQYNMFVKNVIEQNVRLINNNELKSIKQLQINVKGVFKVDIQKKLIKLNSILSQLQNYKQKGKSKNKYYLNHYQNFQKQNKNTNFHDLCKLQYSNILPKKLKSPQKFLKKAPKVSKQKLFQNNINIKQKFHRFG